MTVPVAMRHKAWVCGRSPAEIVVSNPAGAWISVCCECCVLSGRSFCVGLITRPEDSYRIWYVFMCDLECLMNEKAKAGITRSSPPPPRKKRNVPNITVGDFLKYVTVY